MEESTMEESTKGSMTAESITEQLVELFRENDADFVSFSKLPEMLKENKILKAHLNLPAKAEDIKNTLRPYCGDKFSLKIKRRGKNPPGNYLLLRSPFEQILLRFLQKRNGETAGKLCQAMPFSKSEFKNALDHLMEQGLAHIKLNEAFLPCLHSAKGAAVEAKQVSEEAFRAAFQELEQGNFYVRICDMRRRLNWPGREFDTMLIGLRDAGKLQLQDGDTDFFTMEDIRDSFVDENGFRMLTMMWRQK
ncbi:MAG: hypothetical protein LBQ90_11370 [Synergistaceae bacterium]|jgi:hypothetical protein|nr:hypothetical protein [Synergistaceae bacterium]